MDMEMVKHLARLSKLNFTDVELEKAAVEMTDIIEIMDSINDIDITYDPIKDNHNVYLKSAICVLCWIRRKFPLRS